MLGFAQLIFYMMAAPFYVAWWIFVAIWEFSGDLIDKHENRKREAAKTQQKQERDQKAREVRATFNCTTCSKPVGLKYRKGPATHIKTVDNYFCSSACQQVALDSSEPYDLPPLYVYSKPGSLYSSDRQLVVGKSSNGMYFEAGRCVQCGQALTSQTAEFEFCSDTCEDKATRPFLDPQLLKSSVEDDTQYQKDKEILSMVRSSGDYQYEEARKEAGISYTRAEFIDKVERELKVRETLFRQKVRERKNTALYHFQEKWVKQREYVLTQEREKHTLKTRKEQDREDAQRLKDAAENWKRLEKVREEERWKPKPFKL
jgi:hypothetical protein